MLDPKLQAQQLLAELRADLEKLIRLHDQCMQTSGAFATVHNTPPGGDFHAKLSEATRQMREMNQSFNLQYLQLQQKMQQENRQFTMLSNIMKTKHDTAKNAISNIR